MYNSTVLKTAIEQSSSLTAQALILAEWNLNFSDNIKTVGNYRYRWNDPTYGVISSTYSVETSATINPTYYNALVNNTSVFAGIDNSELSYFKKDNEKEKLLFSLTDCLERFRPRSGINKIRYDYTPWTHYANESMHQLPRYYLASKNDKFKYWTSYRKEPMSMYTFSTSGTDGWVANSNTIISTGLKPSTTNSVLILTPTAAGTVGATSTTFHKILSSTGQYTASAVFACATAGKTVRIKIDWYDAAFTLLSSSSYGTETTINLGSNVRATITSTPVTNALYAKIVIEVLATTNNTDIQYVDKISISYNSSQPSEASLVRGVSSDISSDSVNGGYRISDANPFVVYNRPVPTNRLIVKMQTHVSNIGSVGLGTQITQKDGKKISDPFYENPASTTVVNQRTPLKWYVEYLDSTNNWQIAKSFNKDSVRSDGKRIIGADGYVELAYGITNIPNAYLNNFTIVGTLLAESSKPAFANVGEAYLIGGSSSAVGVFHVWNGTAWETFTPTYGWVVAEETITANTTRLTNLVSPDSYSGTTIYDKTYREFQFIYGIRIRIENMAVQKSTFDLIEMSPRLVVDLSDKTLSYSIEKTASDIGNTGMPVGQLLASSGDVNIFDYDQAMNPNNPNSILNILDSNGAILNSFVTKNVQFKFYEILKNIYDSSNSTYSNYYVPIKTMYADGFPQIKNADRTVSIKLRNLFFYLESIISPPLLFSNITLSMAASILLDSVGFSNYKFNRLSGNANDKDDVIPYFFVAPDTTVAQVLNDLAQSTQTAIFFNENNELVFMSKNRFLPNTTERPTEDITLYGTKDFSESGASKNYTTPYSALSNIISISSQSNDVFNAGKITYSNKYIQKTYGNLREASTLSGKNKKWYYKPVLLWEVGSSQNTMPQNEENPSNAFSLSAIVLNSTLSSDTPSVNNSGEIINNIIDFGAGIKYISRYKSYFYANGEIIKYDAIEYSIPSKVKTGFVGTITNGSNIIKLTTGDTSSLSIGETITLTLGSGISGAISSIKDSSTIYIKNNASSTGSITFNVGSTTANVWLTSEQEYANQFAKLPFGGSIYATGKVRIYSEPYYNDDGINFKTGNVAKHGRAQFGTKINTHKAQLNSTTNSNLQWQSSNAKAILMDSKYIFNTPYYGTTVTFASASTRTSPTVSLTTINTTTSTSQIKVGWYVSGTNIVSGTKIKTIVSDTQFTIDTAASVAIVAKELKVSSMPFTISAVSTSIGPAGLLPSSNLVSNGVATVSSLLRDKLSTTFLSETSLINEVSETTTPEGAIRSSALILKGNDGILNASNPLDYTSYILNDLGTTTYCHYGTRMRVLGTQSINGYQTPVGAVPISTKNSVEFTGSSGGLCFRVNQNSNSNMNTGYYFEIVALNQNNVYLKQTETTVNLDNVYFYKITKNTAEGTTNNSPATPILLWSGSANIIVDSGDFAGVQRLVQQKEIGCYDLAVESIASVPETAVSVGTETFDLYINDVLVARVKDTSRIQPGVNNNTVGMFTRGTSKVLFENIYALNINNTNTAYNSNNITPFNSVSMSQRTATGGYSKFGISSAVSSTFLTGISSSDTPQYDLYMDEFGTIMREVAYFNIRYDKAYPALLAKLMPTVNSLQAYAVSGFNPTPYGAEFMVFNTSDNLITLDETTANYLRIQGITFTQQSSHDLTVDDYFSKTSDFSNPATSDYGKIISPSDQLQKYSNIQSSRMTYGRKEFTISGPYIQNEASAKKLMEWMVDKNMSKKTRLSVGIEIFPNPMIQLGDIVKINYADTDNINQISYNNARFVVYNISYTRNSYGPSMTIYLSEVP